MNWLNMLTVGWAGYRTHSAVILSVVAALATAAGMLPTATGQSLAVGLAALAMTFQRFAQSDLAKKLDELLLANGTPPDSPAAVTSLDGTTVGVVACDDSDGVEISDLSHGPVTLRFPTRVGLLLLALLCLAQSGHGQEGRPLTLALSPQSRGEGTGERVTVATQMRLSPETRSWFHNPDGSCVQCSIGMAGVHCNDINAASLLWDTSYGPAVRGGSWPSRVEAYCDQRGIKAWSVTAASVDETIPWMLWAAKTGRFAAIGAGQAHFQTLYGYEPQHERPWMVCNNNSTQRIDRYSEREFKQLHAASGPWVVILERASSDPPAPVKWWR